MDAQAIEIKREALNEILGEIVAVNVSLEDYMEHYAADHCEWVEGQVIKMSPAEIGHNELIYYCCELTLNFDPLGASSVSPL